MRKGKGLWLAALVAVLAVLAGCGGAPETGSVILDLSAAEGVRAAFLPAQIMIVTQYRVALAGPSTWGPNVVTGTTTIDKLLPGEYAISVSGLNVDGIEIASAAENATVTIGGQTSVAVVVQELAGTGDHSGTLHWQPDVLSAPIVSGKVKDSAGVSTDLVWIQDNVLCVGTTGQLDIPVGWYTVILQVYDDLVACGGLASAMRIVKDVTTVWETTATVNTAVGGFELSFSADLGDPLVLNTDTPEGSVEVLATGSKTIALTSPDTFTAVWYVNGAVALVDSPTFTLDGAGYDPSVYYQVSAVAFSADGKHANSMQWNVVITSTPPPAAYNDGDLVVRWSVGAEHVGATYNYEIDHGGMPRDAEGSGTLVNGANEFVITGLLPDNDFRVCLRVDGIWYYAANLTIPQVGGTIADFGGL
jgi:hypothetical protein